MKKRRMITDVIVSKFIISKVSKCLLIAFWNILC